VKWSCLYLQAICALLAIALVHCDDRLSSLVAMGLFATCISASVLLIAAHEVAFNLSVKIVRKASHGHWPRNAADTADR
jgi:hypothetical protein